jgi:programmed cell death 6-interacting protein
MSHNSLTLLSTLMLAQAQECSWKKALLENVRHGAIARLAIKLNEFYLTVAKIAEDDSVASLFPSSWPLQMRTKAHYFEAIAHHRKGIECEQNGKFGEQITRLQLSDAALKKVQQDINGSQSFWGSTANISDALLRDVHDLQDLISEQLASAVRDNDSIYMDVVPPATELAPILSFEIVKPIVPLIISQPFNEMDLTGEDPSKLKPLFTKLVPFAVHQAISVYVDRKDLLLKMDILKKIKELDEECNRYCRTSCTFKLYE